jgi:hypothetical protein
MNRNPLEDFVQLRAWTNLIVSTDKWTFLDHNKEHR